MNINNIKFDVEICIKSTFHFEKFQRFIVEFQTYIVFGFVILLNSF